MNKSFCLILCILSLVSVNLQANVQSIDSSNVPTQSYQKSNSVSASLDETYEDDDFVPGLLFLAIIFMAFFLGCIGAGIILTTLGVMIILVLASFGIISTSLIVGLSTKSFSKGFKTLVTLSSGIGGLLFGSSGLFILNLFHKWWENITALLLGSSAGLVVGLAIGLSSLLILKKLLTLFKVRFNLTKP